MNNAEAETVDVTQAEVWPSTCDGIEQDAFEAWASSQRYNMITHPLHWLFLNKKTDAARQGWKAGLKHAAERAARHRTSQPSSALREALPAEIGRLTLGERLADGERMCAHSHYVTAGHPLYWPQMMGQYDDSDPYCLEHAIELAESDSSWCEHCVSAALSPQPEHPDVAASVVSQAFHSDTPNTDGEDDFFGPAERAHELAALNANTTPDSGQAAVDRPCETLGLEDMEPGCCEPCRARAASPTPSDTDSVREAIEALDKYGSHKSGCTVARALPFERRQGGLVCTCGFEAALAKLTEEAKS